MKTESRIHQCVLGNGATFIGEPVPGARSLAIGVWLKAGSRDERPEEDGIAHFVEHMAFKGTRRRNALEIARSLEAVGGSLDAFTGRESTCYSARVLSESLPLAVDVICDLVSDPLFPDDQLDREKAVVLEEIRGLEDAPEELVHDYVAARLWNGHPLAGTILGTESSVRDFDRGLVRGFYDRLYRSPGAVVAVAGGFEPESTAEMISSRLRLPNVPPIIDRTTPETAPPALVNYQRSAAQEYLCLATPAPSCLDERRHALQVLSTVLGGGMSSRLFQSIREEAALAYSVYSYTDLCHDSGIFCSFLGVSPENAGQALESTFREMKKLREDGITRSELDSAKAQVRGGALMSLESLSSRMGRLARGQIYHGRYQPVEDMLVNYDRLTTSSVMDQAGEFLDPDRYTLVAYGPTLTSELNVLPWGITIEK